MPNCLPYSSPVNTNARGALALLAGRFLLASQEPPQSDSSQIKCPAAQVLGCSARPAVSSPCHQVLVGENTNHYVTLYMSQALWS